ncbi:hypothetical protein BDQ17DRAFT_1363203 [Cyathus striatus]|nr:hypothetical protein BDQ17DRAFT_1363203 [Cyathus striatus]
MLSLTWLIGTIPLIQLEAQERVMLLEERNTHLLMDGDHRYLSSAGKDTRAGKGAGCGAVSKERVMFVVLTENDESRGEDKSRGPFRIIVVATLETKSNTV